MNVELAYASMAIKLSERPYVAVTFKLRKALHISVFAETTRNAPRLTNPLRHAVGQSFAIRSNCGRARRFNLRVASSKKDARPAHLIKAPAPTVAKTSDQMPKCASNPPTVVTKLMNVDPTRIF